MTKTIHSIHHDSPMPIVIEDGNIVDANSFGTTKMPGVDHNSSSLNCSVSDTKDSVDFRIDHSYRMKVDANVNDRISCTIILESNIEEDENALDRFKCAAFYSNSNPVFVSRQFQYQVDLFFKEKIFDN